MIRRTSLALAMAATLSLIVPPQLVFGAQPPATPRSAAGANARPHRPVGLDVQLTSDRQLIGQIVDPSGQPRTNQTVRLLHGGQLLATTQSGADGVFRFQRVPGGVHQLALNEGAAVVRCWQPQTAPPAAREGVLLVSDGQTVRGQHPIAHMFTNPLFIGLAIAAAIAIPIAINNSDDDNASP